MSTIKSLYFQAVNFIQGLNNAWFFGIWAVLLIAILLSVMKFFKVYNGEQKKFEKISLIILALICFVLLVVLTILRKQ